MCPALSVRVRTHTHTHTYTHRHPCTHTLTGTHAYINTGTHAYTYTQTFTGTHTNTQSQAPVHTHTPHTHPFTLGSTSQLLEPRDLLFPHWPGNEVLFLSGMSTLCGFWLVSCPVFCSTSQFFLQLCLDQRELEERLEINFCTYYLQSCKRVNQA